MRYAGVIAREMAVSETKPLPYRSGAAMSAWAPDLLTAVNRRRRSSVTGVRSAPPSWMDAMTGLLQDTLGCLDPDLT